MGHIRNHRNTWWSFPTGHSDDLPPDDHMTINSYLEDPDDPNGIYSTSSEINTVTASPSPGLSAVNASYITINGEEMVDTAPSDTVSVDLVMPSDKGYSQIYWYLAGPSDSGFGNQLGSPTTPSGSGIETEVTHTFTMPSGASGVYTFTAYIYPHSSASDQTVYTYSFKIYCS